MHVNEILFQYSPNRSTEYVSKSFTMKRFNQLIKGQSGYSVLVEEEDSKKSAVTPSHQSSSSGSVSAYTIPQTKDWGGDGERSCLADTEKNSYKWYSTPSVSGTFGKK